jgi:hypothetical protein
MTIDLLESWCRWVDTNACEGRIMASEIKLVIAELRAAREVIAHFREGNDHSDECDIHQENLPCDCGYVKDLEVIKKYDEARR